MGICGNCYRECPCVVPSALPVFSLRSWVPTGSGILGAQGYPWKGCYPPPLLESPQVSPVCWTDRSECVRVCMCACPDLCLGLCVQGAGQVGLQNLPVPACTEPA
ncbi:Hypothetical predicted protein [Marmota monax]|uniref:Uncharacterized protein n=1 Tax=Marmota monax TaxID=9995 RepID=A0A5E4AHZ4_MARMO|nr:hypothetical protein GHT09_000831 [Marmota monax]VTJ56082.1 Hypothetical predicted protein [Marmota monax]